MAEIEITERAVDWLRDAEPDVRDRITKKLRSIEDFPDHYLKRLNESPHYRLRIGTIERLSPGNVMKIQ